MHNNQFLLASAWFKQYIDDCWKCALKESSFGATSLLVQELLKYSDCYTVPCDECKGFLSNELGSFMVTSIHNRLLYSESLIMSRKKLKIEIPSSFSSPHKPFLVFVLIACCGTDLNQAENLEKNITES